MIHGVCNRLSLGPLKSWGQYCKLASSWCQEILLTEWSAADNSLNLYAIWDKLNGLSPSSVAQINQSGMLYTKSWDGIETRGGYYQKTMLKVSLISALECVFFCSRMFVYWTALENRDNVSFWSKGQVCLQSSIKRRSPSRTKGMQAYCFWEEKLGVHLL